MGEELSVEEKEGLSQFIGNFDRLAKKSPKETFFISRIVLGALYIQQQFLHDTNTKLC